MTEKLFEEFIRTGLYLRSWSPKTARIYREAWKSFQCFQSAQRKDSNQEVLTETYSLTRRDLEAWVVWMRQNGRTPAGCNIQTCVFNSFCAWLNEEGHLAEKIHIRKLKSSPPPVTVLSDIEIRKLLGSKPKHLGYLRSWMLVVVMLDTGCRIDEALNLKASDIDFDNLLLTVLGKGSKPRRIPFSEDLRRHLWPYSQKVQGRFLFSTRTGTRVTYRNAYRNMKTCCANAGVIGPHVHPHNLRHSFSCTFIKRGGSVVTLSRILGHCSLTTTNTYLRGLQMEDFAGVRHLSPLARLG